MFDFSNKVIVVTGAAGNLGKGVVLEALKSNAIVCGLDYKTGRLGYVTQDALDRGAFLAIENINIKDKELMIKAAKQVMVTFGKVDIVVNTIGGFSAGERVDQISSKTWQAMFDLNVQSVLNSAAAFIPEMEKGKGGKFIAVGSRASLRGGAKMGAYAASKGALLRLIECMAEELKPSRIQVNCVLPGTIDTPENRQAMPNADTSSWVSPIKVAHAILFLASPLADAITGTALPVYGC
jgi:NAD(P)-dependent dehydrogenase (short-subunit alcohol dehydrogenase family)